MKGRNSNIEALRIISMILIVMCHYSSHELGGTSLFYSFQRYIAGVTILGGGFGDALFILISGYYMCEQRFTGRKLARLWGEVFCYSLGCYLLIQILQHSGYADLLASLEIEHGFRQLLMAVIPIGYGTYGFATTYVVLMMISPLLNLILHRLRKEQLLTVLAMATVFWSILPIFTRTGYEQSTLGWFIVLYLYAGYIRLYVQVEGSGRYGRNIALAILAYAVVIISAISMIYVGHITGIDQLIISSSRFASLHSPFVLLFGVEAFLAALKMQPVINRAMNVIASASFGVYLIHNNEMFKPLILKWAANVIAVMGSPQRLILHTILTVLLVYVVCVIMDLIRQRTVERLWMAMVDCLAVPVNQLCSSCLGCGIGMIERIVR